VLDAAMPASFEDVGKAKEITIDVGLRILNGISHAGLGRQVDNDIEAFFHEQRLHSVPVGQVETGEGKPGIRELSQTIFLQPHVVIIIEIVEPDDLVATLKKMTMKSDEPGGAGDKVLGHVDSRLTKLNRVDMTTIVTSFLLRRTTALPVGN
jgi:hypothetical protein